MQTINGYLPVFTGYYETRWDVGERELDQNADDWRDEDGLSDEQIQKRIDSVKWAEYRNALSKLITEEVGAAFIEYVPGIKSVTFESLVSPREYNFTTDSIYCVYEIDTRAFGQFFRQHVKDNYQAWESFLADKFTTRSGFISFYSPSPFDWHRETRGFTTFPEDKAPLFVECLNFLSESMEERELQDDYLTERVYERAVCNGNCMVSEYIPNNVWEETEAKEVTQ